MVLDNSHVNESFKICFELSDINKSINRFHTWQNITLHDQGQKSCSESSSDNQEHFARPAQPRPLSQGCQTPAQPITDCLDQETRDREIILITPDTVITTGHDQRCHCRVNWQGLTKHHHCDQQIQPASPDVVTNILQNHVSQLFFWMSSEFYFAIFWLLCHQMANFCLIFTTHQFSWDSLIFLECFQNLFYLNTWA